LAYQEPDDYKMVSDENYKLLQVGSTYNEPIKNCILDNEGDNISEKNPIYSELTGHYWIWKNTPKTKYIGVEHHRRHFDINPEVIPQLIEEHGIIVPGAVIVNNNNEEYYKECHNIEDLHLCEKILKRLYPEMATQYDDIIKNGTFLIPNNSFISTYEAFEQYCEFMFSIFNEFEKEKGFKDIGEWTEYVKERGRKILPSYHRDSKSYVDYQMRIFGFLGERLFTVWLTYNYKNFKMVKYKRLDREVVQSNMRSLLCCIGRQENKYIREYVEYYLALGVSNICLFDNNYDGEEDFRDVIGDYIDSGFVILKDYRNRKVCQLDAYNECYETYGNEYNWIMFFDIDEFLYLNIDKNLHEYLARDCFDDYDAILVNWLMYDDNGLEKEDSRGVLERFTHIADINKCSTYPDVPENFHIKAIVKGGLENVKWENTVHKPSVDGLYCNGCGFRLGKEGLLYPYDFRYAGLKHFSTKTAEEYVKKVKRGFPDGNPVSVKRLVDIFFAKNEATPGKVEIFKKELGIDMSYLLPSVFEGEKDKNTQIFTLCYDKKEFQFLNDAVITPLQVGAANGKDICELKDNTLENISDKNYFFIENTGTYWIWQNIKDAKYKGQMQYRRPLIGVSDKMNFDEIFNKYDVITCEPFHHPSHKTPTEQEKLVIYADTVEQGYTFSHCLDDISILELVVKMQFPEYAEDWDKYIKNGPNLYYSNGFIMKSEDFDAYSEFLFKCLEGYLNMTHINNENDLFEHVKYNIEVGKYGRYEDVNNVAIESIKWQCAIGGFLSERLWTLWLQHNFSDEKILKLPYQKMEENMYT
jgi:hypothetical protein